MQHIRPIEYHEPKSLAEASAILRETDASVLAGGTDIAVILRRTKRTGAVFVNIKKIPGLTGIDREADGSVHIGANTTIAEVAAQLTESSFTALHDGCASLGTPSVRNIATVGGNIGRASPASDVLPAAVALNAKAVIYGTDGKYVVDVEKILSGPGRLALAPGEFVIGLILPACPGARSSYHKLSRVHGADCALAGVAAWVTISDGIFQQVRIGMASVGPVTLRAPSAENFLAGKAVTEANILEAAELASQDSQPISDLRASAEYRKDLIRVLAARSLSCSAGI